MTNKTFIRAWYASIQRLLELLDFEKLPREIQSAFLSPDTFTSKIILANTMGAELIDYLRKENIHHFYRIVAEGRLKQGIRFAYQGHFYGKGFGVSNKTPHVSLSSDIKEIIPGKKLLIEFSKNGLITDTAYTRLSGSTNLFTFCTVTEITDKVIKAVPYLVGDLTERTEGQFDLKLTDILKINIQDIDQFKDVNFQWNPSKTKFNELKNIPEQQIKELFCKLLNESEIPKDWGGEECDIFTSNLRIDGKLLTAAFLLKGPSKFHEMTLADCGKNGDQIYRLFNTPADVYILQHCHKVTPAVRKTMEAFALTRYSRNCMFTIIDGYDTARILHSYNII